MHQLIRQTNPQWHEILSQAFAQLDPVYLKSILNENNYLPNGSRLLAAFNRPLDNVRYILLGESPYPRALSANGYAFWDNAVAELWSDAGLSKAVNRATSLRNLIKMLLLARGDLNADDCSQQAIAQLDKSSYCQTATQLFESMLNQGFLLLNATLIYRDNQVNEDARQWRPFLQKVLQQIAQQKPDAQLILFGKIAARIEKTDLPVGLISEHPYNLSFITNSNVLKFFKPFDLLHADER